MLFEKIADPALIDSAKDNSLGAFVVISLFQVHQ